MKIEIEINKEDIFTGWQSTSPLFEKLIVESSPSAIIEVGTWKGGSAIHMAKILKKLNLDCVIYCVDTWLGATEFFTTLANTPERNLKCVEGYPTIYYQFLYNIRSQKVDDIIIPYPMTSNIAFQVFKHRGVLADLIYIDGSHEYDDVKMDLNNYYQLLKPGGIMFGDFEVYFPGSRKAYLEFMSKLSMPPITHNGKFWEVRK